MFTGTLVETGMLGAAPVDCIGIVSVCEIVALVPEVPGPATRAALVTVFPEEDAVRPVVSLGAPAVGEPLEGVES
jgi:hypothetical protein